MQYERIRGRSQSKNTKIIIFFLYEYLSLLACKLLFVKKKLKHKISSDEMKKNEYIDYL